MTGPVAVDPSVFSAASLVMGQRVAGQLAQAAAGLGRGLAGAGAMAGSDPGGVQWATSYDQVAAVTAGAVADLANACHQIGALLEQTGFNHASAEVSSDPSHAAPGSPDVTNYGAVPSVAAPTPPSANGGSSDPPHGWSLIESVVGYVWPNGDPGRLRDAGRAWTACANALRGAAGGVPEAVTAIQSQRSPEVTDAVAVCQAMGQHINDVAGGCDDLAKGCHDYAEHLDKAHHDIIKELEELVAWTVAIEAAGAAASFFSFGAAEVPTQIAEGGRIAATAAEVGGIISRLIDFAGTVSRTVASIAERIGQIAQRVKAILGARLSKATTEEADSLPALADNAEASAEKGLDKAAEDAVTRHRQELGMDPATGRFRPGEADTGIRIENERGVQLSRSPQAKGPDWIGSDGKTYDAVGNFPSQYFDQQWPNLQSKIADHLGKADYIPVDVSEFTPSQIAQVKAFIQQYGDRVFLVGEK